jgi:hypothetical protein
MHAIFGQKILEDDFKKNVCGNYTSIDGALTQRGFRMWFVDKVTELG